MGISNIVKTWIRWLLLIILFAGAIASAISAIWTIMPDSSASKECMIGFMAHCTFTPISTLISLLIAIVFVYILIRTKYLKSLE